MNDSASPVEVFAGTAWEAALVKSLLENAEIETFLKDEIRGTMVPWHVSPGGIDPVKVVVSSDNVERALQVVRDFEANRKKDDA
jgi:nicotinic acid phosphoribosyltransferase